jgi:hypothetical protein
MGLKIISVMNFEKAEELKSLGFNYTVSTLSENTTIYNFVENPELMAYINGKFSNRDFYISKNMCFGK